MIDYTLHIKNMVCPRCIKVVTEELERLQLPVKYVELGEVQLGQEPSAEVLEQIKSALAANGFALLQDRKAETVEQVKLAVIDLVRSGRLENLHINISDYIAEAVGRDYGTVSSLFSTEEGITLTRYVVLQKVERAKELLAYNELTLSQIADKLGYSSVAHLSAQFKQVTKLTPSDFKKQMPKRNHLDQLL